MTRKWFVAVLAVIASPGLFAQDAFTVCKSAAHVTLRLTLPSGGPVTLIVRDGEMGTISTGGYKLGVSATIVSAERGTIEVRYWELSRGVNGAERIQTRGKAEGRVGDTLTPAPDAVYGVVTGVEIVEVRPTAEPSIGLESTLPRSKCCVTCGGTTACSYCWVGHDCGSCCTAECCG